MATKPKLTPPKKALNAYFHFQQDKRPELSQANPGKKSTEIVKLLGVAYKKLSITEKKRYEDMAAADKERYEEEYQEYTQRCKIQAQKRTKSLPTDNDEEDDENSPKKIKGDKAKDTKKATRVIVNGTKFESAAGSRPGPNPDNPEVRINSLNQICFVQIYDLTGEKYLVPVVDVLEAIVTSDTEELNPEILYNIEAARQKDREDRENGKRKKKVTRK